MPSHEVSVERKQRRRFSREFKIEAVRLPRWAANLGTRAKRPQTRQHPSRYASAVYSPPGWRHY